MGQNAAVFALKSVWLREPVARLCISFPNLKERVGALFRNSPTGPISNRISFLAFSFVANEWVCLFIR